VKNKKEKPLKNLGKVALGTIIGADTYARIKGKKLTKKKILVELNFPLKKGAKGGALYYKGKPTIVTRAKEIKNIPGYVLRHEIHHLKKGHTLLSGRIVKGVPILGPIYHEVPAYIKGHKTIKKALLEFKYAVKGDIIHGLRSTPYTLAAIAGVYGAYRATSALAKRFKRRGNK